MIGRTYQVKRGAVCLTRGDLQYLLGCRVYADKAPVFGYQYIAAAHRGASGQEHAYGTPIVGYRIKATFLACIPVQQHALRVAYERA